MNSGISSGYMKSAIRAGFLGLLLLTGPAFATSFENIIRQAALQNGFVRAEDTHIPTNTALVRAGQTLFQSKALSLNGNIACQSCHLDEFGTADGIPNAVAVGGKGKGRDRVMSEGGILPRNTLAFWGRGGKDFPVFFWDGKVDFGQDRTTSQFGNAAPSDDPLVTAVHLPIVEIREMLAEDGLVVANKTETVTGANKIYNAVMKQLREREPEAISSIAKARSVVVDEVLFIHVAQSIADFIRHRFRIRRTKFHRFVFENGPLSQTELRGAQLFYGKGKCANCHSGAYLTDFDFHAVPLPQLGFGKNGFGIDYGRFNVTHDPADIYRFRTPPLFNVEKTSPYGHSGSVAALADVIIFHFDPLRGLKIADMSALDRHEYYKRLAAGANDAMLVGYLDDDEVKDLVAFLKTLSFEIE